MNIAMVYHGDGNGYAGAVRELGGTVHKGGRKLVEKLLTTEKLDALIAECTLLGDADYSGCRTPLLLIDPFDGSQLRDRHRLKWPSVRAVFKRSCLRPAARNNEWGDRYHVKMMMTAGVPSTKPLESERQKPPLQLTDAELAKVYPFASFACHPTMKGAAEKAIDFAAERRYSAHFAGTTSYSGTVVQTHRMAAFFAARDCPAPRVALRDRSMGVRAYRDSMRDTHCVLSPYGWGETCYRDFEAWLCGAVLVKPTMGHVATWPENLFAPGETFLQCGMMFEDAGRIVELVAKDWPAYRKMRETARERAIFARDRQALAGRLVSIIGEVL